MAEDDRGGGTTGVVHVLSEEGLHGHGGGIYTRDVAASLLLEWVVEELSRVAGRGGGGGGVCAWGVLPCTFTFALVCWDPVSSEQ